MSSEFELIARYFARRSGREDVELGVGDDAALLCPPPDKLLAVTVDTLISGVHFPEDTSPSDIGFKSLAVNLSDLAAMGAEPAWVTLALSVPEVDPSWLHAFAEGFYGLANRYGVALVGGDTTRGALSITVQAFGWVARDQALRRSGAHTGDAIYVTGTLGDAGLGLAVAQSRVQVDPEHRSFLLERLNRPEPRVEASLALRGLASAMIDISDGLIADLGHLLAASGVGARVELACLPVSDAVRKIDAYASLALNAGDDYELAFTVAPEHEAKLSRLAERLPPFTRIGTIQSGSGLQLIDAEGNSVAFSRQGYDHFQEF